MSATATAPKDTPIENPLAHLSEEQLDELGREFDAIRDRVMAELGDRDRRYIESMIEMQRRLAVIGRVLLLAARNGPARAAGTTALSAAKILENMEIGHNVLHGQWDWMNDPDINSTTWDWDTASTAEVMLIDPAQRWIPVYILQPTYNLVLAAFFEWGVALHDLDVEASRKGTKSKAQVRRELEGIRAKAKSQVVKDYVAWPLISGLA